MTPPRLPLALALTGTLPLIYAALLNWGLPPIRALEPWMPYWDDSAALMLSYGGIILVFMAGVLWGFATLAKGKLELLVSGLSILPALYVFFYVTTAIDLIYGFGAVFVLDLIYWRLRLAPPAPDGCCLCQPLAWDPALNPAVTTHASCIRAVPRRPYPSTTDLISIQDLCDDRY